MTEKLNIDFTPHTVYVLCGPSMCGKSTFAAKFAVAVEHHGFSATLLSSDSLRGMLGSVSRFSKEAGEDRHSDVSLSVSDKAFSILFSLLKGALSFPVCSDAVIVDTTGMSEQFREDVRRISQDFGYKTVLVTFDYKSRQDYLMDSFTESQKTIVLRALDRFRKRVLTGLKAGRFDGRIKVKNRYVEPEVVPTGMASMSKALRLDFEGLTPCVIGDSHECVDELKELIEKVEAKYSNAIFIHLGDYLDKGNKTKEMVDYLYARRDRDLFLHGNHEAYIEGRLTGRLQSAGVEVEASSFQSLEVLMNDEETRNKFLSIFEISAPFMEILPAKGSGHNSVFVSHAPCTKDNLGKVHEFALKNQRNYRIKDRSAPIGEELKWLYDEADGNHPLHIFGHIAHEVTHPKGHRFQNRVFLDTACVYGGALTAAVIKEGRVAEFISVKSTRPKTEELSQNLGLGVERPFSLDDYDLDVGDLRLIRQVENNKVRFISATMPPGPSTDTEIEPISAAVDFLKSRGVTEVAVQLKWMGSRAQLYLFKDRKEDTFMVSRSGWKIRHIEGLTDEQAKEFIISQYDRFLPQIQAHGDMILDGELLPWSALGSKLIEGEFGSYEALVATELLFLQNSSGLSELTEFKESLQVGERLSHLSRFSEVLARYSKPDAPTYQPFSVLWTEDGVVRGKNEESRFYLANPVGHGCTTIRLDNREDLELLKVMFNDVTVELGMEGVVLKPLNGDIAPVAMKVRSEEYLRLVYGYDWMLRREKLCRQKNISGKVAVSFRENKLGKAMLAASSPDEMKRLVVQMIGELKAERGLDPRL